MAAVARASFFNPLLETYIRISAVTDLRFPIQDERLGAVTPGYFLTQTWQSHISTCYSGDGVLSLVSSAVRGIGRERAAAGGPGAARYAAA